MEEMVMAETVTEKIAIEGFVREQFENEEIVM